MPRGRRRFLAHLQDPTREQMFNVVKHVIWRSTILMVRHGRDDFFRKDAPQLADELMETVEDYAVSYAADRAAWRTWYPLDSGYYIAAWKNGKDWVVSELWYSPGSVGTGWWQSRIYLHQEDHSGHPIEVIAWMPKPHFKPPKEN